MLLDFVFRAVELPPWAQRPAMSSQEGRIKIEHLLRQLEHAVQVDRPEAPSHGTVPDCSDDRGGNADKVPEKGKEPQKTEHAAPEEPLAKLARACSLESAEQASANRRAGDAAIGADEDSDAEVGSDEDDEDGREEGSDERDFVMDEEDYEGGASGSGESASRRGADADRRSQVAVLRKRTSLCVLCPSPPDRNLLSRNDPRCVKIFLLTRRSPKPSTHTHTKPSAGFGNVCVHLHHSLWRVILSDLRAKAGALALCRISARLARWSGLLSVLNCKLYPCARGDPCDLIGEALCRSGFSRGARTAKTPQRRQKKAAHR